MVSPTPQDPSPATFLFFFPSILRSMLIRQRQTPVLLYWTPETETEPTATTQPKGREVTTEKKENVYKSTHQNTVKINILTK